MIYVLCSKPVPIFAARFLCDRDLVDVHRETSSALTDALYRVIPPAKRSLIPSPREPNDSGIQRPVTAWQSWAMRNAPNMKWLAKFVEILAGEMRQRNGHAPLPDRLTGFALSHEVHFPHIDGLQTIPIGAREEPDLSMADAVEMHRNFYRKRISNDQAFGVNVNWTNREVPKFLVDLIPNPFAACDNW